VTADGIRHQFRLELARIIEASCVHGDQFRHRGKSEVNRSAARATERVELSRIRGQYHCVSGNEYIGSGSPRWADCSFHIGSRRTHIRLKIFWSSFFSRGHAKPHRDRSTARRSINGQLSVLFPSMTRVLSGLESNSFCTFALNWTPIRAPRPTGHKK